jgi:hypothetical protein
MRISHQCAPWNISSGAKNLILQTLQFRQMDFCRKFPGETSISYYSSSQGFVESLFNINA